jgi:hypothetical protein
VSNTITDGATLLQAEADYTIAKHWRGGGAPAAIDWPKLTDWYVKRNVQIRDGWLCVFQTAGYGSGPKPAREALAAFDQALPGASGTVLFVGDQSTVEFNTLSGSEQTLLTTDKYTGGALTYTGETVGPAVGGAVTTLGHTVSNLLDAAKNTAEAISYLPFVLLGVGALVVVIIAWKGPELLKVVKP